MKLLVAGCSCTSGSGLYPVEVGANSKDHPALWVNLCHNHIPEFKNLELLNVAKGGFSNLSIFISVLEAMSQYNDIRYIMIAWTSVPRYNFNVGFELYDTWELFHPNRQFSRDHHLNQGTYTDDYLKSIATRFLALHDLHYEIVNIIKYINIIKNLSGHLGTKLININAICPWDNNFFKVIENCNPGDYTEFTQEILRVQSRCDEEIFKLYEKQHQDYITAGGICEDTWVNLYDSFVKLQVDVNHDHKHPGEQSNQLYFELVQKYMQISPIAD